MRASPTQGNVAICVKAAPSATFRHKSPSPGETPARISVHNGLTNQMEVQMTAHKSFPFATTRNLIIGAALNAALLFGSSAAYAQSTQDAQNMLKQADANGDGNISWQEVKTQRANTFSKLDRNRDGFVDKADRPAMPKMASRFDQAMQQVTRFDANRDGRVSKAEMIDADAPGFTMADADNNKIVTAAELETLRSAR
jgi:Ca2+-binding EF-hand superfamily protein